MQIVFEIYDDYYDNDLRKQIDKVKDLHKYTNVLPKSIQINSLEVVNISLAENLF